MENQHSARWDSVRNLTKSAKDKKIAGVCGGFGEHTPVPARERSSILTSRYRADPVAIFEISVNHLSRHL